MEKSQKDKEIKAKPEARESARIEISEPSSRVSDPVKMYLKEMGCISLLTREGEVVIAKRIEAGEKEALWALLDCSVGVEHIIELGDRLEDGQIKIKDVINDLEDDDSYLQLGEKKEFLISLIDSWFQGTGPLCRSQPVSRWTGCLSPGARALRLKRQLGALGGKWHVIGDRP